MFGISGEHLLIMGIVLLVLGPRRLPELGHTMGKAIRNFKDSLSGVEDAKFRKLDGEQRAEANAIPPTSAASESEQSAPRSPNVT